MEQIKSLQVIFMNGIQKHIDVGMFLMHHVLLEADTDLIVMLIRVIEKVVIKQIQLSIFHLELYFIYRKKVFIS